MAIKVRITIGDAEPQVIEVEAGGSITVTPGDVIELIGVDRADLEFELVDDDLIITFANGDTITFVGLAAALEDDNPATLAFGELEAGDIIASINDLIETVAPAAGPGAVVGTTTGGTFRAGGDIDIDDLGGARVGAGGPGQGIDPTPINPFGLDPSFGKPVEGAGEEEPEPTLVESVPVIGTPDSVLVDEDDLTVVGGSSFEGTDGTNSLTVMGSLGIDFGDDLPGTVTLFGNVAPVGLTSHGDPVTYVISEDGMTLTAITVSETSVMGFESGDATGWSTAGGVFVIGAFDDGPTEGAFQAALTTGSGAVSDGELETLLGVAPGTIDGLSTGDATEGAAIKKTLIVEAGDTLSFDWNFLTVESTPSSFNDFAFVVITDGTGTTVLADTFSSFTSSATPFNEETGYATFEYTFTSSGVFMVGVGVVDVGDTGIDSALLVDNFTVVDTERTIFTVTVDPETGKYVFTLEDELDHPDGGGENIGTLSFGFTATDGDGDSAEGFFSVGIVDDVPTVDPEPGSVDEDDLMTGERGDNGDGGEGGSSFEGTDPNFSSPEDLTTTGSLGIDYGADGPAAVDRLVFDEIQTELVALSLTSHGDPVTIQVSEDGLTLKAVVTESELPPGPLVTETHTITASGSGSVGYTFFTLSAPAAIRISTDGPTIDPQIHLFVDDGSLDPADLLASDDDSGPPAGQGGNSIIVTGDQIGILPAGDYVVAVADFQFLASEAVAGVNDSSSQGSLTGDVTITVEIIFDPDAREVFTVVLDPLTGEYTFTLTDELDHPDDAGENTLDLSFSVLATDFDGDTVPASFTVEVVDDVPVADGGEGAQTTFVDEDDLLAPLFDGNNEGPADSLAATGDLNIDFGADGPGTVSLAGNVAPAGLESNGDTVSYSVSTDGTVLTATAGGRDIFTVTTNAAAGTYTFELLDEIDHQPGTNDGQNFNTLTFDFTAFDFDGDSVDSTLTVGVRDDVPVQAEGGEGESLPAVTTLVDEDDLTTAGGSTFDGNDVPDAEPLEVMGDLNIEFGADGPGTGVFDAAQASFDALGLKSQGEVITLSGQGTDTLTGTADGREVFTVTLDVGTGKYTFELKDNIDHKPGTDDGQNLNTLTFAFTATDFDGDTVGSTLSVKITDDVPVLDPDNPSDTISVSETNLLVSIGRPSDPGNQLDDVPVSVSGTFFDNVNFGADGPGLLTFIDFVGNQAGALAVGSNGIEIFSSNTWKIKVFQNGDYTFTLLDDMSHTGDDLVGSDDIITLPIFTGTVTDGDGDSVDVTLTINVEDDGPVLDPDNPSDTISVSETNLPVNGRDDLGNQLDAVPVSVNGTFFDNVNFGADGPGLLTFIAFAGDTGAVAVASSGTTVSDPGVWELEVFQNGDYTFTLLDDMSHGDPAKVGAADTIVLPVFTGTVTDGDGDPVDVTLTVNIEDDGPVLNSDNPSDTISVSETDLVRNVDPGNQLDAVPASVNGSFFDNVNFGADGPGLLTFIAFGTATAVVVGSTGATTIFGPGDAWKLEVFENGNYTFTLLDDMGHGDPDNVGSADTIVPVFTGTVTDGDGDSVDVTLTVNIEDDGPVQAEGGEGQSLPAQTTLVDEDDLTTAGGSTFDGNDPPDAEPLAKTGDLNIEFGADGPGAGAFSPVQTAFDALGLKSQGKVITLAGQGTDTLVGYVESTETPGFQSDEDREVFTITLDVNSGTYTFELKDNIDHKPGTNDGQNTNTLTFAFGVTDSDGDSVGSTLSVVITDDVPLLKPGALGSDTISVSETDLVRGTDPGNQLDTVPFSVSGSFFDNVNFGADGPGLLTFIAFAGDTVGAVAVAAGSAGTTINDPGGAWKLEVFQNGDYTFTLLDDMTHTGDDLVGSDDIITLPNFTGTVTDGDGDAVNVTLTVKIEDDGPLAGNATSGTVQEANLAAGTDPNADDEAPAGPDPEIAEGTFNVAFGADGGSITDVALISAVDPEDPDPDDPDEIDGDALFKVSLETLTSGGKPLQLVYDSQTGVLTATVILVGTVETPITLGDDIFTLEVRADGTYTFTLLGPLDHPDGDDPDTVFTNESQTGPDDTIVLTFQYTATDGDDDTATGDIVITVEDDAPILTDDFDEADEDGDPIGGNVLTNDLVGADGGTVTGISQSAQSFQVGVEFETDAGGFLKLNSDGSYTYTPPASTSVISETFVYEVTDGDGDVVTAALVIDIDQLPPDFDISFTDVLTNSNAGTQYYLVTWTQIDTPANTITTVIRLDEEGGEVPDFNIVTPFEILDTKFYEMTWEYIGGPQNSGLRELTVEDVVVLGTGGGDDISIGVQGSADEGFEVDIRPETSLANFAVNSWNEVDIGKGQSPTDGDDLIIGTKDAETIDGKDGNDFIDGDGGGDTLLGGTGNDILVWEDDVVSLDGGDGFDVVRLEANKLDLDLDGLAGDEIKNIEAIDLTGKTPGDDHDLTLEEADVIALNAADTLFVFGDGDPGDAGKGDTLTLEGKDWTLDGPSTSNPGFVEYTSNTATVLVDEDITVLTPDVV